MNINSKNRDLCKKLQHKTVYSSWMEAISTRVSMEDQNKNLFTSSGVDDFQKRRKTLKKAIENSKAKAKKANHPILKMSNQLKTDFQKLPELRQMQIAQSLHFEAEMNAVVMKSCTVCHTKSLGMNYNEKKDMCSKCCSIATKIKGSRDEVLQYYQDKNLLPIWKDRQGKVHYTVPSQLSNLTLGEKLLIQKCSSIVPIVHINNGVTGRVRLSSLHSTSAIYAQFCRDVTVYCITQQVTYTKCQSNCFKNSSHTLSHQYKMRIKLFHKLFINCES